MCSLACDGNSPFRWHNCLVRTILSVVMLVSFLFIVKKGAAWLMALVWLMSVVDISM